MPFVITLAAQKGGVGKSTIALNLADALRLHAYKAAIIDTDDPQRSLLKWRGWAEDQGREAVPVVGADANTLSGALQALVGMDVVIIDTPGHVSPESRAGMAAADVLLVPVVPGAIDVAALDETLDALANVRTALRNHPRAPSDGPRAMAIANKTKARQTLSRDLSDAVVARGLAIATTRLTERAAYVKSAGFGQSVLTFEPRGAAALEIEALLQEVMA